MLADDTFQEILYEDFIDKSNLLHGWICTLDDKIFINNNRGWIFPSKQQAQKAFYNSIKWKARAISYRRGNLNSYWMEQHPNARRLSAEECRVLQDWRIFKKDLIDNHHLQFIQL